MLKVCEDCIGCQCCVSNFPENLAEVEGNIEVIKQPESEEQKQEIINICPVGAIKDEE